MDSVGDWVIMLVAAIVMGWWIVRRLDRWLHEPPDARLRKLATKGGVEEDEYVLLLKEHGFQVLSGKHRIPLGVAVDNGSVMPTRLYFDYLAEKDNKYYLVKLDRPRQPMEWTASALRERLLVYALLFPDCHGIVIVLTQGRQIKTVRFKVEAGEK